MAQLAIQGHTTRGKEVIEILEMLGGKNVCNYGCDVTSYIYSIDVKGTINWYIPHPNSPLVIYTLEEFIKKFPYKVGDRVLYKTYGIYLRIKSMCWNKEKEQVFYRLGSKKLYVASEDELQPYKEETMEKINVAKLLKDCPQGMELNCTVYDECILDRILEGELYPIKIRTPEGAMLLTKYGSFSCNKHSKCIIFPKGKTTWEGFVPPCKFKDGDIIFTHANCLKVGVGNTWISIFKERRNGGVATYVDYAEDGSDYYSDLDGDKALLCMESDILRQRFATEEEKEKLFKAIKANGYKWNTETKTLEKLVDPTTHEILSDALTTFGAEHQRIMCIEECAELIDALAKYDRGRADAKEVITELADVSIMVEQMAILFGKEEFEAEKERKLKRLQERINEDK